MAAPIITFPVSVVNGVQRTTREGAEASIQSAINVLDGRITDTTTGKIGFATWAELAAVTGTVNGQLAQTTADAGTHTDPVVGGTVSNTGEFRWSTSPAGWERIGDPAADAVVSEVEDARQGETALVDNLTAMSLATAGVAAASAAPNLWPDPEMRSAIGWTGTKPTRTTISGRPAFSVASAPGISPLIPWPAKYGDTISLGYTVTKAAVAGQDVRIWQYNASGTQIDADTDSLPSGALTASRRTLASIARETGAVAFALVVAPTVSGDAVVVGDVTIAPGASATARPSLKPLERYIRAFGEATMRPNKIAGSYLTDPSLWVGSGTMTMETIDRRTVMKITGGEKTIQIPRANFADPNFRVSLVIEEKTGTGDQSRIIFRQRTSGNATVGTDTSQITLTSLTVTGPQEWSPPAEAWDDDDDADHMLIYLQAAGTSVLKISWPCVVEGTEDAAFRPPFTVIEAPRSLYVDPISGDDGDNGTYTSPLKTWTAGISKLAGRGTLWTTSGLITSATSLASAVDLHIRALPEAKPVVHLGVEIPGPWTPTTDRPNVWEAASVTDPGVYIFVEGMPQSEITAATRHAMHRGRAYRSPNYALSEITTSTLDVSAAEGTFLWSSGTAYVHLPDDEDPNDWTIYRASALSAFSGGVLGQSGFVHLAGIDVYMPNVAFNMKYMGEYLIDDCNVYGTFSNGWRGDVSRGTIRRCYGTQIGNDIYSFHHETLPEPPDDYRETVATMEDCAGSLAKDDTCSPHEKCILTIRGLLSEYSKAALTPASGAECQAWGLVTRGHREWGVSVRNSILEAEGGVGTICELHEPVIQDEVLGMTCTSPAESQIKAYSPLTVNCATAALADYGRIETWGWEDIGSSVVKGTSTNGGQLIVNPALPVPA